MNKKKFDISDTSYIDSLKYLSCDFAYTAEISIHIKLILKNYNITHVIIILSSYYSHTKKSFTKLKYGILFHHQKSIQLPTKPISNILLGI